MDNTDIQHLRKLAEIGKHTSEMIHDINNNFAIIIGILGIIDYKYTNLDPNLKKKLGTIEEYVMKSAKLADRTLSKVKKSQNLLSLSGINKLIKKCLAALEYDKKYQNIEIGLIPEKGICRVFINAADLEEVLINLIKNAGNAIFSNSKKGNILVKTYASEEHLYVEISDTGPGIPDEIQDKIFEPFFTTGNNGEGTGLGLSSCSKILSKYGGELMLDSEYIEGARFFIKLPLN